MRYSPGIRPMLNERVALEPQRLKDMVERDVAVLIPQLEALVASRG